MKHHQTKKKDVRGNSFVKLEMAKFNWSVVDYHKTFGNKTLLVGVLMEKDGAKNQREFEIKEPAEQTEEAITAEVLKLTPFKESKVVES